MANAEKYNWIKIADALAELQFDENNLVQTEVEGKKICLAKYNDLLFACTHKCPHAGAFMAEGYIDAIGNIVCPHHRYKFSLKNGRNISGEGYFLKTFPVEIRENGIYVGIEPSGLFNWLK